MGKTQTQIQKLVELKPMKGIEVVVNTVSREIIETIMRRVRNVQRGD